MVQQLSASATVVQDLSFIPITDAVEFPTIHHFSFIKHNGFFGPLSATANLFA